MNRDSKGGQLFQSCESDEIEIHWVEQLPVADLRPAINMMTPPGEWLGYYKVRAMMDRTASRLESLRGKSMRGPAVVLIDRAREHLALGELPTPQRELALEHRETANREIASDEAAGDGEASKEAECQQLPAVAEVAAQSIAVAVSLLTRNDMGQYVSAEEYADELRRSPDPRLTMGALKIAGTGGVMHGVSVSFKTGAHVRFPELIESKEQFHVRLSNCIDTGFHEIKADFKRMHTNSKSVDSAIGELLMVQQRVTITLGGSSDITVIKLAMAVELEVEALVTATVNTYERTIKRLTLVRMSDRDGTLKQVEQAIGQLRLPRGNMELAM